MKIHGDSTNTSALTRAIESDLGNDQIDNNNNKITKDRKKIVL